MAFFNIYNLKVLKTVAPEDDRAFGTFNIGSLFESIVKFSSGMIFLSLVVGIATIFAGVIGIGNMCRALNTPVTGGNVSFYNETIDHVVPVSSAKIAEMVKVYENTHQSGQFLRQVLRTFRRLGCTRRPSPYRKRYPFAPGKPRDPSATDCATVCRDSHRS